MKTRIEKAFCVALALILVAILTTRVLSRRGGSPEKRTVPQAAALSGNRPQVAQTYGKLPLSFEVNQGQSDPRVQFLSRGRGYALFLTGDEMVLSLRSQKSGVRSQNEKRPWPVASRQPSASRNWKLETGNSKFAGGNLPGFSLRRGTPGFGSLLPTSDFQFPIPDTSAPKPRPAAPSVVRLQLVGANARAKAVGLDELPGKTNYFIGNDPKKWRTNVATYAKVKYQGVYPGVDLVFHGQESGARSQEPESAGGQLEYDFVVAPGADPRAIRLAIDSGQSKIENRNSKIDANGDLVIPSEAGEVRFHKPVVYQEQSSVVSGQLSVAETKTTRATDHGRRTTDNQQSSIGNRQFLDGKYVLLAENRIGFEVPGYDPARPLVIDPVLAYSTYLGGSGAENGIGIAVDSAGNAYVTGETNSIDFPTVDPSQPSLTGGYDVFVTKFNAAGSALIYSTYLGGSGDDVGYSIAVDSAGNAYITGLTNSLNLPTVNPVQATFGGASYDAFVAKLNAAGSALVYSTYLGGSGDETGEGIAVDSAGNAYVGGETNSTNFPTAKPFQASNHGEFDAFVTKLNAAGTALVYSTYLGGTGNDGGVGIALDSAGNAYITGWTWSSDFPTANPLQAAYGGGNHDAFVTELNAAGSALVYSTYLGGSGDEEGQGIAVDSAGNAYITGYTTSTNFPTASPFQASLAGGNDVFVTKLTAAGSALVFSTYLGGARDDYGYGIAVDSDGDTYITGHTASTDFPTADPLQPSITGADEESFVTKLNPAGSALIYSTYLGGTKVVITEEIAVDTGGSAYITGTTNATDYPTVNALQTNLTGLDDAFIIKISTAIDMSPDILRFGIQILGTPSAAQVVTVTNSNPAALTISGIAISGTNAADFGQTNDCPSSLAAGASCTINVTFAPTVLGSRTGTLSVTDSAPGSPHTAILAGTGDLAPTADSVTPTPASGVSQTFSLAYSVHNGKGYADLTYVRVLINPRVSPAQGCYVLYYQPANKLYLENDAGAGMLGPLTPGTAGTLANSQCTVNGTGTTASGSGATLTLNLSVSAVSSFLGTRNIYLLAQDSEGLNSGWQNRGTWTPIGVDTAPTADSVTPTPASGANQTFSLAYSAHNGKAYTDLTYAMVLINPKVIGAQGCYVRYYQPANQLYLQNDAATGALGPLTPGTAGTLANSQCTVNGSGTTVSGSGPTLTLNLSLSAASSFLGAKDIYMLALDSEGSSSDWQNRGTWTPIGADTPPTADTVTPTPASGASQTFSLTYSVQNGKGHTDLTWVRALFNSRLTGPQGCYVLYYQPWNQLYLENDAATGMVGPLTPGTVGTLANSQCTLNGTGTTVLGSGATLTLNLSLSAGSSFLGTKNIYLLAQDSEGTSSVWQNRGTWTP